MTEPPPDKTRSGRALLATNFFLADVQTGLGPFLAAYLASAGWNPARVGVALTIGGLATILLQTPAGALVDRVRSRRMVLVIACLGIACGALMLAMTTKTWVVYAAQGLIGSVVPFLAPTIAAITLGLVGPILFDRQFGKNQALNSAGNVACALIILLVSREFGNRAIFLTAATLTIPTIASVLAIRGGDVDESLARGGKPSARSADPSASIASILFKDRVLPTFMAACFFFHLANAAMLPQLGELLSRGSKASAAPFMSACILVTQLVIMCSATSIGRLANQYGRKLLLMVGFGVLPVRALLYTLTHAASLLVAVQILDGIANSIFGVVSILVVADCTRGTGRFNLAQGVLGTAVGMGAALSNSLGGVLIQRYSFKVSFLALGVTAVIAMGLLAFGVPETLNRESSPRPEIIPFAT